MVYMVEFECAIFLQTFLSINTGISGLGTELVDWGCRKNSLRQINGENAPAGSKCKVKRALRHRSKLKRLN